MFFTSKDVNFRQKVVNHQEKQMKKLDKTFLLPEVFIDCVPLKKIQLNLLNPQVIKPWAVHCRQSKWELLQNQTCRARIVREKRFLFHFEILAGRRNLRCWFWGKSFLKCYHPSFCKRSLDLEGRNHFTFKVRGLLNTGLGLGRSGEGSLVPHRPLLHLELCVLKVTTVKREWSITEMLESVTKLLYLQVPCSLLWDCSC